MNFGIEVKNITKLYGQQKALDNVSFSIKRGEIVGLLGPNGAGKSTLLKILSCYIPPTEGTAQICGFDIIKNSLEVRKQIGYLPEHNSLYIEMYVKEFLMFIASIHKIKEKKKRIAEIIELTGLTLEQKKKIRQLSKGYRQRVGIAQALIHNPKVLILDEPTSGLDPNQIIEIRELIKNIGEEKTVLLSTHILQEVEAICSRAIIIDQGKIILDDTLQKIKEQSTSQHIIVEFDKNVNLNELNKIEKVISVDFLSANKYKIETTDPLETKKMIFHFALQKGLTIISLETEKSTLENIFKKLTLS